MRSTVEEKEEEVVDVCMELLPATHVVLHLMEYVHMCVWMCVDVMSWVSRLDGQLLEHGDDLVG